MVLEFIALYICYYSGLTANYGKWRRFWLSLIATLFLASVSYNPLIDKYRSENTIPPPVEYMKSWSTAPLTVDPTGKVVSGMSEAYVTVDGAKLDKFKKKFDLMAVAYHDMNYEDPMSKAGLCKSNVARIRDQDIPIKIPLNEQFRFEMAQIGVQPGGPTFVLLALPKKIKSTDFQTLNEAEDLGAEIIGQGSAVGSSFAAQSKPQR